MSKGVIYVCTTAVPGLVKLGKTETANFTQRMYNLEHDGYRNVTALKRVFAIEVEDYEKKEKMLQEIFEKSRVSNTELFALEPSIVIQLLSSFAGTVIFPKDETKEAIFRDATDTESSFLIPDGTYYFNRKKKSDNKTVIAKAKIDNGRWTLLEGSVLGIVEDKGGSQKAREVRATLPMDEDGTLLADVDLGVCSPSFVGNIVMNQSNNGWSDWKNENGDPIDIYRKEE